MSVELYRCKTGVSKWSISPLCVRRLLRVHCCLFARQRLWAQSWIVLMATISLAASCPVCVSNDNTSLILFRESECFPVVNGKHLVLNMELVHKVMGIKEDFQISQEHFSQSRATQTQSCVTAILKSHSRKSSGSQASHFIFQFCYTFFQNVLQIIALTIPSFQILGYYGNVGQEGPLIGYLVQYSALRQHTVSSTPSLTGICLISS